MIQARGGDVVSDLTLREARESAPEVAWQLIRLAEEYADHPARPACDGETTLQDWQAAGFAPEEDDS